MREDDPKRAFQRMGNRTTFADALHQAGHVDDRRMGTLARPVLVGQSRTGKSAHPPARRLFEEAEALQAESQPGYPLLYSLRGFRYCDLLLAEAERAAWQSSPHAPREESRMSRGVEDAKPVVPKDADLAIGLPHAEREGHIYACRAVSERAKKMFEWRVPGDSLLDIALNHLTLGRAAFYEAILQESQISNGKSEIEEAVSGLRASGNMDELPRGLLTRAWWRWVAGNRTGSDSAQSDLDEAWDIAERGSMKLHMADVRLYRARLFGVRSWECGVRSEGDDTYPWESAADDIQAAEALITACGYGRRLQELADAKVALGIV
jgi:hypothetical protein